MPTIRHWNSVFRVLRYLKETAKYSVLYGGKGATGSEGPKRPGLQDYYNADYAGDIVDRKLITGYLFTLNEGPVTWTSTKQRCVAISITESEYIALSEVYK